MSLAKFFQLWGKAEPGFKYAMGFPWPNEGVLQKNDFTRRNGTYATGFFGRVKDKVRVDEVIRKPREFVNGEFVSGEVTTIKKTTINEYFRGMPAGGRDTRQN